MKNFKFLVFTVFVFIPVLLCAAGGSEKQRGEAIVWKFSTFDAKDSQYAIAYRKMWERIEKETNGRLKVVMYDLGQMGNESDLLQGLQTGSLETAQIGAALLAGYSDAFNVGDLPFLFNDYEHAHRFAHTPEASEMNKSLEKSGLLVWYWNIIGYRQPNLVKNVIKTTSDFKGLKWRTMDSPVQIKTMSCLGAVPIVVAYSEIYNALNTGVVDAWMNDGVAFKNLSIYEVAPYYTDIPLFASTQTCVISKKAFEALPEDLQSIVKSVVTETLPGVIKAGWEQNRSVLDELVKTKFKGSSKITDVTPYLELVEPVYKDLVKKYPVCQKYIDAVNRVR